MWREESTVSTSIKYDKEVCLKTPTPSFKRYTVLNGHYRVIAFKRLPTKSLEQWKSVYEMLLKHSMWKEIPEHKRFGISLAGIKVEKEEMTIDPTKLEPNVFYLFSYEDEKYVARKSEDDVIEIYEVVE